MTNEWRRGVYNPVVENENTKRGVRKWRVLSEIDVLLRLRGFVQGKGRYPQLVSGS